MLTMPATPTAIVAPTWAFTGIASDPIVNTFAVMKLGSAAPWNAAELELAIDVLGDEWSKTVGLRLPASMKCTSVSATGVEVGPAFSVTKTPIEGDWSNTGTMSPRPPWECYVVNYSSGAPGRSGKGRTYLAGVNSAGIASSGLINAANRALITDAMVAWQDAIEASAVGPSMVRAVYSRTRDSVESVVAVQTRELVGIQRDRRVGSS